MATLALWTIFRQQPISRKVSIALSILFLGFAVFNAWREQLQLKNEAISKLDSTKPKFSLEIRQALSGTSEQDQNPQILLTVALTNAPTGFPSIADNWRVEITLPSGQVIKGRVIMLSDGTRMTTSQTGFHMNSTFQPIYGKALPQPLPPGGRVIGDVLADFPGLPRGFFAQDGVKIAVSCVDVLGTRVYASTQRGGPSQREWFGYPGMQAPPQIKR